jgi:protein-L-isoaspartate(D-aspartate) O-methyltransferase
MDETSAETDERAHAEMVEAIARHFRDTADLTGEPELTAAVRTAMLSVPRHRFVPEPLLHMAYADSALPIGFGQTISQPFIVALMTQLGRIAPGARVLEVGTGSGYEAAVLAEIAADVYTIELVPELAERSGALLDDLGFGGVRVRCGDGFDGWPEAAPFDAILVTACADEVPRPLVEQLSADGRLVIPIGRPGAFQELQVVRATGGGQHEVQHVLPVAFVPFVHE